MSSSPDVLPKSTSTFVNQFNPRTGANQWKIVNEDYDYQQEIAQSAYADMLHDYDRNRRYHEAIRHVISSMKSAGRDVHVLDIGTGTGLLSMMAVLAGADTVIACEAFEPVAQCAEKIIKANGMGDKINVIHKRSTELAVGEDMPRKANVLVAELFDTELIGEGALRVYQHAADHLLTPDAILVPCKARMYIQVLESPFLWSHHSIEPFSGSGIAFPTEKMLSCHGSPSVFDLQASLLKIVEDDDPLTVDYDKVAIRCLLEKPLMFHEFNFAPPSSNIVLDFEKRLTEIDGQSIKAFRSGTAHAVLIWWELQMEPSNQTPSITMAPENARIGEGAGDLRAIPSWREHWMQAVYFPRNCPLPLTAGQPFCIDFAHDDYSMHFDLHSTTNYYSLPPVLERKSAPYCNCLAHAAWSRSRFAQLNHPQFRKQQYYDSVPHIVEEISSLLHTSSVALVVVSEASLLPIYLHKALSPKNVPIFHLDCFVLAEKLMNSIYQESNIDVKLETSIYDLMKSLEVFTSTATKPVEICILSEPYSNEAFLPWNAIQFWYVYGQIATKYPCRLISPTALRIQAVAMDFEHLWKIRAPVGNNVEGFDLTIFDEMILSAAQATDATVEPHPLWQYTGKARSNPVCVFELSLIDPPKSPEAMSEHKICNLTISLANPSSVNAVAMWAEWRTLDGSWYPVGGPLRPVEINQEVDWCKVGPQTGVTFLKCALKKELEKRKGLTCKLNVECDFDFYEGEPIFRLSVL
ncbi:unnamed protein product [Hymenolepis diminuta]|uniref:Protein arginine N-methyltransferase n=1 Tax=Hymenolepis diminuta TaxID=6216 RepID=A0A564YKK9_HYMDI|nr:unnamed protein product [Hymenolepis diminuta]